MYTMNDAYSINGDINFTNPIKSTHHAVHPPPERDMAGKASKKLQRRRRPRQKFTITACPRNHEVEYFASPYATISEALEGK